MRLLVLFVVCVLYPFVSSRRTTTASPQGPGYGRHLSDETSTEGIEQIKEESLSPGCEFFIQDLVGYQLKEEKVKVCEDLNDEKSPPTTAICTPETQNVATPIGTQPVIRQELEEGGDDCARLGTSSGRSHDSSLDGSSSVGNLRKTCKSQGSYLCELCGKGCKGPYGLTTHLRTHTGEKPFPCPTCGKAFSTQSHLNEHMRTHTGEKPFPCPTCGKAFSTQSHLNEHMRTHTGDRPYSCSICSKAFSQRGTMEKHLRTHTGEKPFSCPTCGKASSTKSDMDEHMRTHTDEKPCSCPTCGKAFRTKSNMNKHMRTHTGEKPYSCTICSKAFSQRCNMKKHMGSHKGEKPFSCPTCGKAPSTKSDMDKHMKTHTGEKPFPCPTCGKAFSAKSHFKEHMRTHTGEKPFPCPTCGKAFSTKGNMNKHMRTHTGEKPYSCSICSKAFRHKHHLQKHAMEYTGENPCSCSLGHMAFNEKESLNRHVMTHTAVEQCCGEAFDRHSQMSTLTGTSRLACETAPDDLVGNRVTKLPKDERTTPERADLTQHPVGYQPKMECTEDLDAMGMPPCTSGIVSCGIVRDHLAGIPEVQQPKEEPMSPDGADAILDLVECLPKQEKIEDCAAFDTPPCTPGARDVGSYEEVRDRPTEIQQVDQPKEEPMSPETTNVLDFGGWLPEKEETESYEASGMFPCTSGIQDERANRATGTEPNSILRSASLGSMDTGECDVEIEIKDELDRIKKEMLCFE